MRAIVPGGARVNYSLALTINLKLSLIRTWTGPWGSRGFEASGISIHSAHGGVKVASPTHRPPLPSEDIPGTHLCYRLSLPESS
jgi:hypothetical protein